LKDVTEMNEILWILQALLALLLLSSGIAKSFMSKERLLATGQTGAAAMPPQFVRFIAVCEMAGAVGLIAPRASGIYPELAPLAAVGLGVIMAGAAVVHYSIHEFKPIVVNAILFCVCIFVAWGRRCGTGTVMRLKRETYDAILAESLNSSRGWQCGGKEGPVQSDPTDTRRAEA
jgi:hypothetical protein